MIGIVGSGNVGANIAFFLAEKQVADVKLFDVQDGLSTGKALDMMEAAPLRGYLTKISGTDELDDLKHSDIVIITAGAVRAPGMKREELFSKNVEIVRDLAGKINGGETKVIIVTEPVDMLTTVFAQESPLPSNQIMGLGSFLDATRLSYLIARDLEVSTENVNALVIGRHASDMIPLAEYTTVSGVPISKLLTKEKVAELFEETRNSGSLIVEMAQRASAYYGPSAVAAELAEAIVRDLNRTIPVSQLLTGQYGVDGVAMGLPSVIGKDGIKKTLELSLNDDERNQFKKSAEQLKKVIQGGTNA